MAKKLEMNYSEMFKEAQKIVSESKDVYDKFLVGISRINKSEEKINEFEKNLKESKRDFESKIKDSQHQNIQTLSIFVAVLGIIFSFVSFSVAPSLDFWERFSLFTVFCIAIYGFIFLINSMLKTKVDNIPI